MKKFFEDLLFQLKLPFVPQYTVTMVFRSGTTMTLKFTKFEYKYLNGNVTNLDWYQNRYCGERLGFIDLGQIASITIKEWR